MDKDPYWGHKPLSPCPMGECPRCHYIAPLSGGLLTHHKRLRRRKWLPCPGIACKTVEINLGEFVPLERPPAGVTFGRVIDPRPDHSPGEFERNLMRLERGPHVVDKRASSAPDEPRYVAGVDPGNHKGPAVVIDRVTGEVVYRRRNGKKGVQ